MSEIKCHVPSAIRKIYRPLSGIILFHTFAYMLFLIKILLFVRNLYVQNIKCLKFLVFNVYLVTNHRFANTLLVIGFGAPSEYESIPLFELLYKKVFVHRLYCGATRLQNQTEIDMLVV